MTQERPDELARTHRDIRMSDADREAVLARLNTALSEGRLTLAEFEERTDGVLRARTYGEIEPFLADLPGSRGVSPLGVAGRDVVELRNHASTLKRRGRWSVPRRLVVQSMAGAVRLDFREALIRHQVVEIDLDVMAGSTTVVLPPGATADIDGVQMYAGEARSKVPAAPEVIGGQPHFVITGSQKAGSLVVRYERRLFRWTW